MGSRQCGECGHQASEQARFCERCGAALTPDATPLRAPEGLARKILGERTAIEGERKQVTVLFTDIVSSMALTQALDTERWGLVLDRFLAIAAGAVHDFEGTVNQFTGDGLMAVFGAPVAHEDHARRACLAVLRLQRDAAELAEELKRADGVDFAIRCGLNSGEVIVGSIGDDLHMDFAPLGNATALGKRMESVAPVGSTAISAATAALVVGEFEVRDLGEFSIKGTSTPQRVLELVGPGAAHTRLEAMAATRGLSSFVGRARERSVLDAALQAALAGDAGAVGIVGDPGVGKSRLVRVFTSACAERGLVVSSADAVAHGRFIPFMPVLAMYRDYFGIGERDAPEVARGRIETTLLGLDSAFEHDLPLLFDFLGVADPGRPLAAMDPDARQRRLLELMARSIAARSAHEAAVLVIEDLHWIDDASGVFLESLVEAIAGTRILLVTTYRPEYEASWPRIEIALEPLAEEASDQLLSELLGADASLDGLAELVASRTGGNPFFIEEVVQGLAETSKLEGHRGAYRLAAELEELVLPPTVQAVLAARIDRLPAREKALVQTMSVIGKEVPGLLLGEVSELDDEQFEQAVLALAQAELVMPSGDQYEFKHPLTQEVAYESQLSERRARAHAAVAAAIECTYPDGLEERAALIAHHCEAAGETSPAAEWHARAAAWAEITSPADGMRHWRRARALLGELELSPAVEELATRARIGILGLAWRLGMSPEETAEIHAEGQERPHSGSSSGAVAAEHARDHVPGQDGTQVDAQRLLLDSHYSGTVWLGGRECEGLELVRRVNRQAFASGDPGLVVTTAVTAFVRWVAGSLSEGRAVFERALDLAGDDIAAGSGLMLVNPYALTLAYRGLFAGYIGDVGQARTDHGRAITLLHEHADPESECYARAVRSFLETTLGEVEPALDNARRALELAESAENTLGIVIAETAVAGALAQSGDFADTLQLAQPTLTTVRKLGLGLFLEPMLLAAIARARLGLGEPQAALAAAEEGVAIMEARRLTIAALPAPMALAQVLIATGDTERAVSVLVRALDVVRQSDARLYEELIRSEIERLGGELPSGPPAGAGVDGQILLDHNYALSLVMGAQEREGLALLRRLTRDALTAGDPGLALTNAQAFAYTSWVAGSLQEGVDATAAAIDLAANDLRAGTGQVYISPYAVALAEQALCAGHMGDVEGARRSLDRAIEIALELGDPEAQYYAHQIRALVASVAGDTEQAIEHGTRGLEPAQRAGNRMGIVHGASVLSRSEVDAGSCAAALKRAEEALEMACDAHVALCCEPMLLATIARAQLALSEPRSALAAAEKGVAIMEDRGLTVCALDAPIALAQVLHATDGDRVRVEAVLARALDVARISGARVYETRITSLLDDVPAESAVRER